MNRSLALALVASLVAAPSLFAQPGSKSATPAPAKVADPKVPISSQPPKKDDAPKKDDKAKDAKPAGDDATKAWEEAAKVGPNHKLLEQFEGEWQTEVKDLSPGQEATDKGTMTSKIVYGGRFLTLDYDGRFHGKFFRGGGIMGYNNTDQRFESTWADSAGTALAFMTGSFSADGKVLTMTGEMTDPLTHKKGTQKEVTTFTGKDSYKQEFFMGSTKIMEITYTKGKAAEKKDDKKDEKKDDKPKTK